MKKTSFMDDCRLLTICGTTTMLVSYRAIGCGRRCIRQQAHRAALQMVARRTAPCQPIDLGRTITTGYHKAFTRLGA